ncbi:MAG: glutamine synthetase [Chloroflexi bacterium]|nr:MAG: glutamine synthetase [Chloroflexota bacterium]
MFTNFVDASDYVDQHHIRMIDLKFSDLWGRWHHVTLSATEFEPDLMDSGVGFDGSSVGLKSVKSGDMALIPDLSTGFLDPFCTVPTLSFICSTVEADTKSDFVRDPRQIAKRAEQYLISTGIADCSVWGPEFEFYVFESAYFENNINSASYRFEAAEACWNSPDTGEGNYIPSHGGYHAIPPKDKLFDLRTNIVLALESANIPIKYHHHEVGGPGQCEIETPLLGLIKSADAAMMVKYMAKMTAAKNNQTVTFLPKPLFGEAGNGMHFHQLLMLDKKNVFYDMMNKYLLSQSAFYYIGGLLKHAPAVMAFTNPTTNSYRRLVPGYEAPVNCFFSSGNRSAAIRIPKYATQPDKVRFEFRPPDATCNPYLAMAAMLLAGIDGIINKIDPTAEGFGPIDENIFTWSKEKRTAIKSLPTTLEEAVSALESDHAFLVNQSIFDKEMITEWIATKRAEDSEIRTRPHPYEIEKYFDI